jgi:tRNA pseudouridine65 synthase
MALEIVYEDEELVAINKPHGLLVHRSRIARDAKEFALQLLRDQIGQTVFPAHRIDRKTSGVLLFSKSKQADRYIQNQFMNHEVGKIYRAIVRGHLDGPGTIDYAIGETSVKHDAVTHYTVDQEFEIPVPLGKHNTSRYSLLEIKPTTGRFHQIRKHMAHIFHPIIGDRPHGCSKQNRLWKSMFGMESMMLHAAELVVQHPDGELRVIKAEVSPEFERVLAILQKK